MYEERLKQILDIGIALTAEKDPDKLLDLIISTAMKLTSSDGGTLYLLEGDVLKFRIMKTLSKGIDTGGGGEEIDLPPVPLKKENICAYAAISKESLKIDDVYSSDLFDFSGPKKYDSLNGYKTKSMIAIPMIDAKDEVIGVMQLINAMDDDSEVRSYTDDEVKILLALASQTAISLANMAYLEEINRQIWSFTEAMTEAIDAKTPYNASHTRKVAEYAGIIADCVNEAHQKGTEELFFDEEHKQQLVMAAFLHDIGKIIIPIEVMNKASRLAFHLEHIEERLEKVSLHLKIDFLQGDLTREEYDEKLSMVNETLDVARICDTAGFLSDELLARIQAVMDYEYKSSDGKLVIPFLTQTEKQCMQIRKGTLTDEERRIMEDHVVMTDRILSKVYFNKSFRNAPIWAAQHHECIDGSGYPHGIKDKALGDEARILAVADICDALLATDRPYKKPLPKEKAFEIMMSMVNEGKLEKRFVEYLKKALTDN